MHVEMASDVLGYGIGFDGDSDQIFIVGSTMVDEFFEFFWVEICFHSYNAVCFDAYVFVFGEFEGCFVVTEDVFMSTSLEGVVHGCFVSLGYK